MNYISFLRPLLRRVVVVQGGLWWCGGAVEEVINMLLLISDINTFLNHQNIYTSGWNEMRLEWWLIHHHRHHEPSWRWTKPPSFAHSNAKRYNLIENNQWVIICVRSECDMPSLYASAIKHHLKHGPINPYILIPIINIIFIISLLNLFAERQRRIIKPSSSNGASIR